MIRGDGAIPGTTPWFSCRSPPPKNRKLRRAPIDWIPTTAVCRRGAYWPLMVTVAAVDASSGHKHEGYEGNSDETGRALLCGRLQNAASTCSEKIQAICRQPRSVKKLTRSSFHARLQPARTLLERVVAHELLHI